MKKILLLKTMLLAFALMASLGSAKADGGEVWIKTLPADLKTGDKVVLVDVATKNAIGNDPDEDETTYPASIKLNDRKDRIDEEAVGDSVKWTVTVLGSGDERQYKFEAGQGKFLNVINDDKGLFVGADGVNAFSVTWDPAHKRAPFLYAIVNDTTRIVGMYSMFSMMNSWRVKTEIDDQIKGTEMVFFRQSDPGKNDVMLSFVNADFEEDFNYEADLKNGADSFTAPILTGAPAGADVTYMSTNEHVATVDASTGVITLHRRGTTDINVVYQGDAKNNYALATYTLRVDDGNETTGTGDHPFTVAEAIQYAKDGNGSAGYNYFVKGIVCKVEESNNGAMGGMSIPGMTDNSVEGTLTYWLSDSGVMKDSLKVSTGRGLDWSDLTADSIAVGDEVLVTGPLSYSTDNSFSIGGSGGGGKGKKGPVATIEADNCMQTLVRKLVVEKTKLYLGSWRDGTELYSIGGTLNGMLGDPTIEVKDTTVANVNEDGWLVTLATGKTQVKLSVPVTVSEGTYTMSRTFRLKVTTTDAVDGHFVLVEDASTLQAGDSLLIVATKDDKSYVISPDGDNMMMSMMMGGMSGVEVTIGENGTIDDEPDDASAVTLRGEVGKWNLNSGGINYYYTSAKKPGNGFNFGGMGGGGGTGTGTGTGTGGFDPSTLFGGGDSNKLRNDSIPGIPGDSAQVKITIDADALATITFRGDSILRFNDEMDFAAMFSSFGGSGSGGNSSSSSSFDPSAMGDFNFSMPSFEVYHPDSIKGVLPKLYRFEPYPGQEKFDYYVAELNEEKSVLTFKGTNTAPDGVTTWDATNTPDKGAPAWIRDSQGRLRRFNKVVFDETFSAARPVCCREWFASSYIKSYEGLKHLNTSEVTNMYGMFYNNWSLKGTLDLSHFNTSKVTNMADMFYYCEVLKTIYVGKDWDTSNVTDGYGIFFACRGLVGQFGATYQGNFDFSRATYEKKDGLLCFNGLIIKDDEDNSEALERYNGQTMNVLYDRVLKADKNEDGTWKSHAYSICLPYDFDMTELRDANKVQTCILYYIKDGKEFIFSNSPAKLKAGVGYVIIVKEDSVRLCANNVTITNQPYEGGVPVYPYEDQNAESVGTWMGHYDNIESADAAAMYGFGLWLSGGKPYFMRVRPDTPTAWLKQFRAIYVPNEPTDKKYYTLSFKQWIAGSDDEDPIVDFPAGSFDADEFPDGSVVGIDTPIIRVDSDDTHLYFDLQGRQLTAPVAKGVYIDNGKKVIK